MGVCLVSFKNSLYSSLSEHEIRLCDTALKKFEEAESKYNKELIDFSLDELDNANKKIAVLAQYQDKYIKIPLTYYFKYGKKIGYQVDDILDYIVSPVFFEKNLNNVLVKSPLELSKSFLKWFPTIHLDTPEVQYATILWLLFEGISIENILNIMVDDVHEDAIYVNGEKHVVPPCVAPFVLKTRDTDIFYCYRKEGTIRNPQTRCNNGHLIRTNNPTTKSKMKHIVDKIFERTAKAGSGISANSLLVSGACWETKNIFDATGMFTFYSFAQKQGWDGTDRSGATSSKRKYAKYDYANYIRTFYPDEAK